MAAEYTGQMFLYLKFDTLAACKTKVVNFFSDKLWFKKYITFVNGGVFSIDLGNRTISCTRKSFRKITGGFLFQLDYYLAGKNWDGITVAQKFINFLGNNPQVAQYAELLSVEEAQILIQQD